MQITIAQDEIEAAIKNYIQEQITVKEDQDIDIDLRATRGEAGFQATINITKAGSAKPVREPEAPVTSVAKATEITQVTKPVVTTTRVKPTVTKVTPKPAPVVEAEPETQDEQPVVQEEEDTQSGVGQAEEAGSDQTDTVEVNEDEVEVEQQEEAAAPVARPSLFGGLKKPVNV